MKKLALIIAWLGMTVNIIVTGYAAWMLSDIANPESWWQGRLQGSGLFSYILCVSVITLPFMLTGGLIAKPRYFWFASIFVGSLNLILILLYLLMLWEDSYLRFYSDMRIPTVIAAIIACVIICEGIYLKCKERRLLRANDT